MMGITADTHIQLGASSPKKDATVGTGTLTLGTNEVAVKVGASAPVTNTQAIVGDIEKLLRYAKAYIRNHTADTEFSITPGGSDNDIVTSGHAAGLITLAVSSAVLTGDKSHFLTRTCKRLIERLLEEAK